ncbi:MAG: ArsR family transcriptional regulator [Methanobacteriaceae archaeon]|nr:ArsR family transcriptional regulator [Methanobacteriaceae archaeon]
MNSSKKNTDIVKIYSSAQGVKVVKSPVKKEILSLLKKRGLSGSEIVSATGKTKSTVSVHLQDLMDAGIISWKPHPQDRRKKIFYLNSRYLGDISQESEIEKDINLYLDRHVVKSSDPFRFFRFMFRTIRVALLDEGINIDPILHRAGFKVGEAFYERLKASSMDELVKNLADFWEENHLGKLEIISMDPPIIQAYDCFECEDLPLLGRPACSFDSGILEAVFSEYLGESVAVEETKCYAQGDQYCQFHVNPTTSKTKNN